MPVVVGGLQLAITSSGPGGVTATNVIAFQSAGGDFDHATMQDLSSLWSTMAAEHGSELWTYGTSWKAFRLGVDPPDTLEGTSGGIAGTDSGDTMPGNVALVVSLSAGTAGRRGRGRTYLPGIPTALVSNESTIGSTPALEIVTAWTDFAEAAAAELWIPAVYSREDSVVRGVAALSIDLVIDTQRRRTERLVG